MGIAQSLITVLRINNLVIQPIRRFAHNGLRFTAVSLPELFR
jgi:hypothetical protein